MTTHNKNRVLIFILVLALTMVACSTLLGNDSEANISDDVQIDDIQLDDEPDYYTDFEDVDDWMFYYVFDLDDYSLETGSNGLSISIVNPDDIIFAYLDDWYTDVTVTTGTEFVEGDADLTYEVMCRSNDIGEYTFAFDMLGFYYVWYYDVGNDEYTELDSGETDSINIVSGLNEMLVSCIGDNLDFSINGELVSSIVDDTLTEGQVGLAVATYGEGTVKVRFTFFNVFSE
jgi:hypothetical protein